MNRTSSAAALTSAFSLALAACGSGGDEQLIDEEGAANETAIIEERADTWEERADDAGTDAMDPAYPIDDNAQRAEQLDEHAEAIEN